MTDHACMTPAQPGNSLQALRRRGAAGVLSYLLGLYALRRQRRALAALDAYRLADLGLSEEQAQAEAARPLWDAPSHWRR